MRWLLAGLFFAYIPGAVFAQVKGEVESIGIGGAYRSNCWTPMVVRVQAEKSGTYQIKVKQEDLDSDVAEFTEIVSLTGADQGNKQEQRFWVYFIPQPTDQGLLDTTRGGSLRELQEQLRVVVCDEKGTKEIAQLPITSTIRNIEGTQGTANGTVRGNRLVIAVSEAGQPMWQEYQAAVGTLEDVVFVTMSRPSDLPEDWRGYEAIDGLLWLRAGVPDPAKPSDEKRYRAIQEYVRQGGKLIICQPPERDATLAWGDMLPVEVKQMVDRAELEPLLSMAVPNPQVARDELMRIRLVKERSDWVKVKGPFRLARAVAKPGTLVDAVINWKEEGSQTPYIVRSPLGAGCITWVAQDLSDPGLTSIPSDRGRSPTRPPGWPRVWDRVFDWKNDTLVVDNQTPSALVDPYKQSIRKDMGAALDKLMELTAKSRTLVLIAVVFFIAYWLAAGPGTYLILAARGKAQLSWFLFGAAAIGATALTVLVVRLVVRGDPELAHVSIVRQVAGEPAVIMSRWGLYIPRDGPQEIALRETAPNHVSYLTAFPLHPAHAGAANEFPAKLPYAVPVREAGADAAPAITIPFRSTLKKLQARWVGSLQTGISGKAQLTIMDYRTILSGKLGNGTEQRLKNVYIAFRDLRNRADGDQVNEDQVFFLPVWEKGQMLDLQKEFYEDPPKSVGAPGEGGGVTPEDRIKLQGVLGRPGQDYGWIRYWYATPLREKGLLDEIWSDNNENSRRSFPMLSLFDRFPPMKNLQDEKEGRVELLRRGMRQIDVSAAVCAGNLVILAEADGDQPLPFPLEVQGQKVEGRGKVFYQFVLPLERNRPLATTQKSIVGRVEYNKQALTPALSQRERG